jgi:hypothetical protein
MNMGKRIRINREPSSVTGRGMGEVRDESALPSFVTSALKMETACFSETLASTYETTWCQNTTKIKLTDVRTPNLNYSKC